MNKIPSVLKFDPSLAQAIGLNEAIVISQIDHYLKLSSKNDKYKTDDDGTKWTYNSIREWAIQFPFWSKTAIGRIFKKLGKDGFLKSRSRGRRGERKWSFEYTLDYSKLECLPEVKCPDNGTKSKNVLDVPKSGQRDSQMSRNRDKGPENTKKSYTKISFPHKKDKGEPYVGEGASTARPISQANAIVDMSSTIAELQNEFPTFNPSILELNFKSQLNYWPKLNTDEVIKKTKARIYEQEIKNHSGKVQRTMHITGGAK